MQNKGYLLTYLLTSRCFTYDDDERLEESQNLLRDGVPKTCEYESTKAGHLDVEYGEDGAEDAADHADQQRRTEHYKVHGDRAPQLQIHTHTHTRARARAHTHTNNIAGVMTIKDIKPQRKLLNTRLATAKIAASHSCIFWQVSEVA